jgi:hypothetical protein
MGIYRMVLKNTFYRMCIYRMVITIVTICSGNSRSNYGDDLQKLGGKTHNYGESSWIYAKMATGDLRLCFADFSTKN